MATMDIDWQITVFPIDESGPTAWRWKAIGYDGDGNAHNLNDPIMEETYANALADAQTKIEDYADMLVTRNKEVKVDYGTSKEIV